MKQLFLYSLLATVLFASCRKSDNSALPAGLTTVPVPLITKDTSGNASIDGNSPNSFTGKVKVDLFFKNDAKPASFDLVVIKNGDKSIVKTIQAGITSFPTVVPVTGLQLATLFGTPVVLGDAFQIGVNVTTKSGEEYDAFPLSGEAYGANVANQPGASTSVTYTAVCTFDINDFAGNFKVTVDDWNDFGVGSTVPITVAGPTKLSFVSPVNGQPIVIDVNATSFVTSIASQSYGDYKAAGLDPSWPYGNANILTVTSNQNFVDPCTKTISVATVYNVALGQITNSGAPWILAMKKQ